MGPLKIVLNDYIVMHNLVNKLAINNLINM